MTLTEYLNQENPVKMPQVFLQDGEFRIGKFYGAIGAKTAEVHIVGVEYKYCAKDTSLGLWTTDSDGNPKSMSCFILPNYQK